MHPRTLAAATVLAVLTVASAQESAPPAPAAPAAPAAAPLSLASKDKDAIKAAVGKDAVVCGKVVKANNWEGKIVFLDLEGGFTVVCFKKNFSKFPEPPEKLYAQKVIEVTGKIKEHKEKAQIEITAPDQVKVVDAPAAGDAKPEPAPVAPDASKK